MENTAGRSPLFQETAIIFTTNFDAKCPSDPLGYFTSGIVSVFSDGSITLRDEEGELESFHIADLIRFKDDINNNDSAHSLTIRFMTEHEEIITEFRTSEAKIKCSETVMSLLECQE